MAMVMACRGATSLFRPVLRQRRPNLYLDGKETRRNGCAAERRIALWHGHLRTEFHAGILHQQHGAFNLLLAPGAVTIMPSRMAELRPPPLSHGIGK